MSIYSSVYPDFTTHSIPTSTSPSVSIHTLVSPSSTKPPLLLLHGYPQNLLIWHLITPHLLPHYTLILPDLRGYGQSDKPPAGENHANYAKSAMASDMAALMTHLGYETFYVCGHDRGGRVAHKLCVDYPEKVTKVMILDICPTLAMYEKTNMAFASAYWHWFFLIQPSPIPETFMVQNPRVWFAQKKYEGVANEEILESYVSCVGDAETARGMCEDYRAAATVDLEEQREDLDKGRKIKCPVKVVWGREAVIEKMFDAVGEWRRVSEGVVEGEVVDCGHFIPEEKPEVLARCILEFFKE